MRVFCRGVGWMIAAGVTACSGPPAPVQPGPRKTAFVEAEYSPYAQPGTGVIEGQAFLRTRGGEVRYGAGGDVNLNPVTSYSSEWWQRTVLGGQPLTDPDPRAARYHRVVRADGEGRFRFDSLPPGSYYIAAEVAWEVPNYPKIGKISMTGGVVGDSIALRPGQTARAILPPVRRYEQVQSMEPDSAAFAPKAYP